MLSVATDLVGQLTGYQNTLNTALDVATSLPLAGSQLKNLPEFDTIFQDSLQSIDARTQGIVNSGPYQLSIPLPTLAKTFTFDLGLNAFLQVQAAGGVSASINPVLVVGFNYQNGTATLNPSQTNLNIGFDLSLPSFQATMSLNGLLFTKAIDAGTSFHGDMRFDFNGAAAVTPHFSGEAHVNLGLTLSFVDPAMSASFNPKFRTALDLDWAINPQTNQMLAPSISLVNFGLDAESFLHGFLGDVVATVQKFTKPIQPFIDIFQTPVPILSAFDSSETIGTLLLKGAGSSQSQQDSFALMIQIVNAVNSIDLSGDTGGAVIPFGTVRLAGDARTPGAFSFDTSSIAGALDGIFNSADLQEVQDAIQTVGNYVGGSSKAGFKFPLLENPGPVIGAILTGQTETMFSFTTGRQHFELAPSIGVGIPGVLGIFLEAGVVFDANLTMGYDTAGLIAIAQDPNHSPSLLLHGFYFDNNIDTSVPPSPHGPTIRKTGLYLQGEMALKADVFLAHASGGLFADINVELVNTDASPHVHLDTMINKLASGGRVFKLGGKVYASADVSLELSLPVGPDITLFSFNLAYVELLNFDPPPPPPMNPPAVIHNVADQHTILLDVAKMTPGSRVTVQPFHNLAINDAGMIYEGDGIRVNYPGETHLYIERKDDVYRDYYNFIALSSTPPDRVAIDVMDPFRVFADEGASNPYPLQTKPAVMLVGGKDVNYKYSEAFDGTKAIAFMVGGYGLNTLIGGTMEFGNFLPSSRVAQAHAHFGNTTGFDPVGYSWINAQIANAVPPTSPSGVIGATMYASRGGLMMGGPGNNSFYALGAGNYEMVGGNWINSFNISPSFYGAPATYLIDGGGGDSGLLVNVPAGEHVGFENSTVVDKYHPAFKALAVTANAGLSATAHGLRRVHVVATAGSSVEFGDTSEVDIQFSISGAAKLVFGGSSAPDVFDVDTAGNFFSTERNYTVQSYLRETDGTIRLIWDFPFGLPTPASYYPVLTVTRTFGTNGKTQSIPFAIVDAQQSSITLDGKGASDSYDIDVGRGTFIDVGVEDSDATTRNSLAVNFKDPTLSGYRTTLTDNQLQLEYYTASVYLGTWYLHGDSYYAYNPLPNQNLPSWPLYSFSVYYSPTVMFGANIDIAFATGALFSQTIINRTSLETAVAGQTATLRSDEIYLPLDVPAGTLLSNAPLYDPSLPAPAFITLNALAKTLDVQANAGNLAIQNYDRYGIQTTFNVHANTGTLSFSKTEKWGGWVDTYNVLGNAGTLGIEYLINDTYGVSGYVVGLTHTVNVKANAGAINLRDVVAPWLINYGIDTQVNVGNNGSLASVGGVVNLSNSNGHYGLNIDDRNNPSAAPLWAIDYSQTRVGGLTLNYAGVNAPAPYLDIFSRYQAFPKSGSSVTFGSNPPFFMREINGGGLPAWQLSVSTFQSNRDGDAVNVAASVQGNAGGPVVFAAANLPAGLSINATTGVISGSIAERAYRAEPYQTTVTASVGSFARSQTISWYVSSAIEILPSIFGMPLGHEGAAVNFGPLSTTNEFHRPVALSMTGLPTGLSFDSNTSSIGGVIALGAAQNGPYHTTIHATDGFETADVAFEWSVTGIMLSTPPIRANHVGDSVDLAIQAATASGAAATFSALTLPGGLSINPTTGHVTGVLGSQSVPGSPYNVTITATQGNDVATQSFLWSILPVGFSNVVTLANPGIQTNHEGDSAYIPIYAASSLGLPVTYRAEGLPPGIAVFSSEGVGAFGDIGAGTVANSPYHVTLTATDGISSDQIAFDWIVQTAGTVNVSNPGDQFGLAGDTINLPVYASSSLNQPLSFAAAGLPAGLSINPQTGTIGGAVSLLASLPSVFQVHVTVGDGTSSSETTFLWTIASAYQPNVISLPSAQGVIDVMSPVGTQLSASLSASANVALPAGASFPFGFVTFAIRGLAAGAAADLTIVGFDAAQFTDYYKYGSTPANANDHWYKFLFGQQTDGDSALGTGMEIVGGNLVLHLIDGGRGDDDLAKNGIIFDIGGPATAGPALMSGDYDRDTDVDGADFLVWQRQLGGAAVPSGTGADGNSSGVVDGSDLAVWKSHFGDESQVALAAEASVAEALPATASLLNAAISAFDTLPATRSLFLADDATFSYGLRRLSSGNLAISEREPDLAMTPHVSQRFESRASTSTSSRFESKLGWHFGWQAQTHRSSATLVNQFSARDCFFEDLDENQT